MMPELVTDLDRVLAFDPRQVVDELPAVDGFEPEAVSDIVGIFLGRHARIVLEAAALHFSAVADGGALRPVKAGGHLELVSPLVVDAEDDGAEIADPGLVAGGVAGHIERRARTVG